MIKPKDIGRVASPLKRRHFCGNQKRVVIWMESCWRTDLGFIHNFWYLLRIFNSLEKDFSNRVSICIYFSSFRASSVMLIWFIEPISAVSWVTFPKKKPVKRLFDRKGPSTVSELALTRGIIESGYCKLELKRLMSENNTLKWRLFVRILRRFEKIRTSI